MAMPAENLTGIVRYETEQGAVQLTPDVVKKYLVNGNGKVTDQEVMFFLALCKYRRLNPFLREAYLIKYGDEGAATIVVGKDVHVNRAVKHQDFKGFEAGIIVQTKDGQIDYRKGTLLLPNETLVGGWAKIYRNNWQVPLEVTVSLAEYERRKKNGELMSSWKSMPATMIRKVALVQALREAFPDEFSGMYAPEEMPIDPSALDTAPVDITPKAPVKEESNIREFPQQSSASPASEEDLNKATIKQKKKYYAMCKEAGLSDEEAKLLMQQETGKTSSSDLTKDDIQKLFNEVGKLIEAKRILSGQADENVATEEVPWQ